MGYGNRIREKYTAKWGVQIVEMIFGHVQSGETVRKILEIGNEG